LVIAMSMPKPGVEFWQAVATGVVANAIMVAVMWGIWMAFARRA
jgi:hypothetical protein